MSRTSARRRNFSANLLSPAVENSVCDAGLQSPDYVDLGSCTEVCEFCGATFWFDERLTSTPRSARPRYNGCCKGGKVVLRYPTDPPELLKCLMSQTEFMHNIRAYNSMFSMTSFGATVDNAINQGTAPYVFKVSGQVSHWVGSLCPKTGERPRFLQLYIYDSQNEVSNRLHIFSSPERGRLNQDTVIAISSMLDAVNNYVKLFRSARELCSEPNTPDFVVKLYSRVADRRYENPTSGTLGAIVYGGDLASQEFDVIIRSKGNIPHRISRLHPSYMPLQYPILFPCADQGWSPELRLTSEDGPEGRNLTPVMFYSYQIHDRQNVYTHILKAGRLFQQYVVDAYMCVEQCRLDFIRANQNSFRSEFLSGIHDAVSSGDTEGRSIGKRVILPSSFTGGPRYMYQHYQDALALCRVYGNPQYFITFTCNVRWPEIRRELDRAQCSHANDRPDIVARVFHMKVKSFINFLKCNKPFGVVDAELYTIEFQKRGLPHCHTLLWVSPAYVIRTPEEVDRYISAELPDQSTNPILHRIVTDCMIHGPCGILNINSTCMKENVCSKKFPKPYDTKTYFDKAGYVYYKRRVNSQPFLKNSIPIDNGFVVPYNSALLLRFDAHINVEYCGWSMLIKYLFKYISKGADRIRFSITQNNSTSTAHTSTNTNIVDEITNYVDGRYICPHEAIWRIFAFPIHHRNPPVQLLAVHLEGMQNITFRDNRHLVEIVDDMSLGKTTLTEWFHNNCLESHPSFDQLPNGLNLRYIDYLTMYRWDKGDKQWKRRKSSKTPSIGRLTYVHPTCGELFYLRLLLTYQTGCRSYADVRTVSNVVMPTFRAACERLGLIGDDKEWSMTIEEAARWATSTELRSLFAHLLLYCDVADPLKLWEKHWRQMSDDIDYRFININTNHPTSISDDDLQQHVLFEIQHLLSSTSTPHSLSDFNLPMPNARIITLMGNRLILEERAYDRDALTVEHEQLHSTLNNQQRRIYDTVMSSNAHKSQLLLFIYGHGGTGKTFLWKTIISALRSKAQIVLAVAASGIASLLLPSGRNAHSRFKIPLELTEESVCYIKKILTYLNCC